MQDMLEGKTNKIFQISGNRDDRMKMVTFRRIFGCILETSQLERHYEYSRELSNVDSLGAMLSVEVRCSF